ncbi:MAG: S8 family serine peptidase [Blastochloris sp.]|nr:S8 family serine peptidase [Blastochloris sp.]
MLKWLSSKAPIELMEGGQKRSFQVSLDEFVIETKSELTRADAEALVKIMVPGGKLLSNQVCYLLVQAPRELNAQMIGDLTQKPVLSTVQELKQVRSLCPVLYPAGGKMDKQGKVIEVAKNDSTRRIVTPQIVVQAISDVSKKSLWGMVSQFLGVKGANELAFAPEVETIHFASGFQSLSAAMALQNDSGMLVMPQLAMMLEKRATPTDPNFPDQWHLNDAAPANINVQTAWDSFTGSGFSISIVDDGVDLGHEDLDANTPAVTGLIDSSFHWDFNAGDNNPQPIANDAHGTACAGIAGAVWNNSLGGAGVAPESTILGIRLIAAPVTDMVQATALAWSKADISSNSWGPVGPSSLQGPGPLAEAALKSSTTSGRGGKGIVYLFANGNDDLDNDYSTYDGYASSPYVIAVGALLDNGVKASYSERGPNLTISAFAGPSPTILGENIFTTDISGGAGYSPGNYTSTFNGTSAATPMVAGVVALMLEANPNLSWRDVKDILIRTAEKNDPTHPDWKNNGGGIHFNHSYGAGQVNAKAAVDLAATHTLLQPMQEYSQVKKDLEIIVPDDDLTGINFFFDEIPDFSNFRVETVSLRVAIKHQWRGDLNIELTSPSGTKSVLAEERIGDSGNNYYWSFNTVRHWGEDSAGTWTVKFFDSISVFAGLIEELELKVYGVAARTSAPCAFCGFHGLLNKRDGWDRGRGCGPQGLTRFRGHSGLCHC